jgi:hypothetical protein
LTRVALSLSLVRFDSLRLMLYINRLLTVFII